MKATDLKPGVFFEFRQPGYGFRRCMWIGIDEYERLNFIHQTATLSRFLHNEEVQDRDPEVTIDVPQEWESYDYVMSTKRLDEYPIDGYPGEDNK